MNNTPNPSPQLRVVFWNARGVRHKWDELKELIAELEVDILLLNETYLTPLHRPRVNGFELYRTDRVDRPGGGTAILVRSGIKHKTVTIPEMDALEVTGVDVHTSAGPMVIYSVYSPPTLPLPARDLAVLFDGSGTPTIVAGDLNANHDSWGNGNNTQGRALFTFAETRPIDIAAPPEPTHERGSILDIALLQNVTARYDIEVIHALSSDHWPVSLRLELGIPNFNHTRFKKQTDWTHFRQTVGESVGPVPAIIRSPVHIDDAVTNLENSVRAAIESSTRTKLGKTALYRLPPDLMQLVREKNRAKRRAYTTLDPADRVRACRLQNQLRREIREYREEQWQSRLESMTSDHTAVWKLARALKSPRVKTPALLDANGTLCHTAEEKAEVLADQFVDQCRLIHPVGREHNQFRTRVLQTVRSELLQRADDEALRHCTPDEVNEIVQHLKRKKAPGPDEISNTAIRELPEIAIMHLVAIINGILRCGHFPPRWKEAHVIFLPKPGKPRQHAGNYRPISLLSCLGKVAEKVVLCRLREQVEVKNVLQSEQFGFRQGHSTTHQLHRVVETVTSGFNVAKYTGAVFLDVAKAFDRVWHAGLLHKMQKAGISRAMCRIIAAFLQRRNFRTKHESTLSQMRRIDSGVPQGSILSPILYAIYVSDMPCPAGVELALYADDTAILAQARLQSSVSRKLSNALVEIQNWFEKWRISVNPEKSVAVYFCNNNRQHNTGPWIPLRMFDADIPWRSEAKYLGVTLDRKMTFSQHTTQAVAKAKKAIGAISCMVNTKSRLGLNTKLLVFNTCIKPVLTYAAPAWAHAEPRTLYKLQIVQNQFLRRAVGAPWFVRNVTIHRDLGMPTIIEEIQKQAAAYFEKSARHENPLVREAQNYDGRQNRRVKRPKDGLKVDPP